MTMARVGGQDGRGRGRATARARGSRGVLVACALVLAAACGGSSSPPAQSPPTVSSADPAASTQELASPSTEAAAASPAQGAAAKSAPPASAVDGRINELPKKCGDGNAEGICAPPREFVQQLCGGFPRPDVALSMFGKGSPWTRAYLNRNVEAWYTTGRNST